MPEPLQQPSYFDPNASAMAQPAPWWKTGKLAIPVGAAVVVVLGAVYLVHMLASRTVDTGKQEALSQMESALSACDNERDPAACKARVRGDAAQNGAGATACKGLDGDAYASCVALSAKASGDVAACASLSGSEQQSCTDYAYFTEGQRAVDAEVCVKIENVGLRASCTVRVTEDAVAAGTCAAAHVAEELCVAGKALRDAIATGDAAACLALATEDARTECSSGIASVDADGDGLVVAEELAAGTNDRTADTDGDGYSDREELASGHDPLKP